jgi:hypothetical protein
VAVSRYWPVEEFVILTIATPWIFVHLDSVSVREVNSVTNPVPIQTLLPSAYKKLSNPLILIPDRNRLVPSSARSRSTLPPQLPNFRSRSTLPPFCRPILRTARVRGLQP